MIVWRSKCYKVFMSWIKEALGYADHVKRWKDRYLESTIKQYADDVKNRYPRHLAWWEKIFAPLIVNNVAGTTANLISIIRILLAIIIFLLTVVGNLTGEIKTLLVISLPIFIIAGLLDLIDGATARALNQISELGKKLDPLADKILLASIFVVMGNIYLPAYSYWLVIFQEGFLLAISCLKFIAEKLPFVMATQANLAGKWKAVFEFIGGGLLFLCPLDQIIFGAAANISFLISIPLATGSIIGYLSSIKKVTAV